MSGGFYDEKVLNRITLDNGSTLSLFLNPDLAAAIQTSDKTLALEQMH
jgi:hypothetical protein